MKIYLKSHLSGLFRKNLIQNDPFWSVYDEILFKITKKNLVFIRLLVMWRRLVIFLWAIPSKLCSFHCLVKCIPLNTQTCITRCFHLYHDQMFHLIHTGSVCVPAKRKLIVIHWLHLMSFIMETRIIKSNFCRKSTSSS